MKTPEAVSFQNKISSHDEMVGAFSDANWTRSSPNDGMSSSKFQFSPSKKSRRLSKSYPSIAMESKDRSPLQLSYQNETSPRPIFQPHRFAKEMRAFSVSRHSGEHRCGPLQKTGDNGMRYFFLMNWPQIEFVQATNQHFLRMKVFLMSQRFRTPRPPPPQAGKSPPTYTNAGDGHTPYYPRKTSP